MGKNSVEKLVATKWHQPGPGIRRFFKRVAAKLMRRLGKRLTDDAPKKLPTRGWSD